MIPAPALGALTIGLAVAVLTGCLRRNSNSSGPASAERPESRMSSPAAMPGLVGLRTYWWVVTDDVAREAGREPIASVLRAYEDATSPIPPGTRELWKRNGLRVVPVPVAELETIRARLLFAGPAQDQTHGQLFTWSPLALGPSWQGEARLLLDNGPLDLPSGRLRLIGRCWIVPGKPLRGSTEVPARLSLELVPQHEELRRNRDLFDAAARARDTLDPSAEPDAASADLRWREAGAARDLREDGLVFSRLALAAELDGSTALVIVPELPNVDWSVTRTPARPDPTGSSPPDATAADTTEPPAPAPALATLGEVMLTDRFNAASGRRLVVVLIPGVPARFRISGP